MPKPWLIIVLVFLVVYILTLFLPGIFMFRACFCRMNPLPYADKDFTGTYIEPYTDEFRECISFFGELDSREVNIKTKDGEKLVADYYEQGNRRLAILVHGFNASPYNNLVVPAKNLYEQGYDLMFIYQRAHLKSSGRKNGMGLIERYDVLSWIDYATKNEPVDSIIVWGVSMGGATVSYASGLICEPKVKALVIDCGFISPHQQLQVEAKKNHVPKWTVLPRITFLARQFRGIDLKETVEGALSRDKLPTLFLHGGKDTVVLPECTKQTFEWCASDNKKFYFVEEAGHGMTYPALDEEKRNEIMNFLMEAVSLPERGKNE